MDDPGLAGLPEVGLCVRALVLVVLTTVLAPLAGPTVALTVLAVVVGVAAVPQPPAYATLLAVTAWCLLTGFVVHDDAVLTFDRGDLLHLGVLLVAAGAGHRVGAGAPRSRTVTVCPSPSASSTPRSRTTSPG